MKSITELSVDLIIYRIQILEIGKWHSLLEYYAELRKQKHAKIKKTFIPWEFKYFSDLFDEKQWKNTHQTCKLIPEVWVMNDFSLILLYFLW